jgi:chromosome segregation ATPase
METPAQQHQAPAQQINPNSLINAISGQRDQALNALAISEAQRADLGAALQQAATELEALKANAEQQQAERDATIDALKAQLAKLQDVNAQLDAIAPAAAADLAPQAAVAAV